MTLPLVDPGAGAGDPIPSPAEFAGRPLIVIPKRAERRAKFGIKDAKEPDGFEDTVTCDVLVDGVGVFQYGATAGKDGTPPKPARLQVTLPALIKDCIFRGQTIWDLERNVGIAALPGQVEQGTLGTKGNPPWLFNKLAVDDPRRAGLAARYTEMATGMNAAGQAVAWHQQEAMPINGYVRGESNAVQGTAAPAAVAPAATAPATGAIPLPPHLAATYAASWHTLPAVAQSAILAANPAPVAAPSADVCPPHLVPTYGAAWSVLDAATRAAIIAANPAPAAEVVDTPPPGFEAAWPSLTPAQRTQIRAAHAGGNAHVSV